MTRINVSNNNNGIVYGNLGGPSTSEGGTSAQTWSYMKVTLSNFNGTGPRIAQIFTINFGSTGMHNTFLGLGGGTVYGSLNVKDRLTVNGSAVALKSDIKSSTAKSTTGISVSASLAAAPAFTGTAHNHTITDNGHTHTYSKAKASGTENVIKTATFSATYSDYGIKFNFTTASATAVTGIGYDTVNSGSAKTGISLANATAGGSVSKPNINVSVTDPGHTHTI